MNIRQDKKQQSCGPKTMSRCFECPSMPVTDDVLVLLIQVVYQHQYNTNLLATPSYDFVICCRTFVANITEVCYASIPCLAGCEYVCKSCFSVVAVHHLHSLISGLGQANLCQGTVVPHLQDKHCLPRDTKQLQHCSQFFGKKQHAVWTIYLCLFICFASSG